MTKTQESVQDKIARIHTPESAFAELEYLEYIERNGEKVCQFEKVALANIANLSPWNRS
jgi:hypothetical protein